MKEDRGKGRLSEDTCAVSDRIKVLSVLRGEGGGSMKGGYGTPSLCQARCSLTALARCLADVKCPCLQPQLFHHTHLRSTPPPPPQALGPNGTGSPAGPPVFATPAAFCGADPALRQAVEGLEACYLDRAWEYGTYIDVEPMTGEEA